MEIRHFIFLGTGRLARHLGFYLEQLGHHVQSWSLQTHDLNELKSRVTDKDTVVLAGRDRELHPLADALLGTRYRHLIHCSGSTYMPDVPGLHPLMTFSGDPYALEVYKHIHWFIDQPGLPLESIFPGMTNPFHHIAPSAKASYHALAAVAGNGSQQLWSQVERAWDLLDLPREALLPYLSQCLENFARQGAGALTGPLARGDWQVVEQHCQALEPFKLAEVYSALARTQQPMEPLA